MMKFNFINYKIRAPEWCQQDNPDRTYRTDWSCIFIARKWNHWRSKLSSPWSNHTHHGNNVKTPRR